MTVTARPAALVTGGSRGIGSEVALRLVAAGYDVTLTARSPEALVPVLAELDSAPVDILPVVCDLAREADVRLLAETHAERFERLDLLVLNAGMGVTGAIEEFPLRRLDKLYQVNLRSAYQLIQCVLPLLRKAGALGGRGGRVIAIASTTGVVGEPLNSAYGATKAGLITLCETLSVEEHENGITATAVCPGYVATAMTASLAVPAEEMLGVDDVAHMVVSLAGLSSNVVVPSVVMARTGAHLWRA